MEIKTKDPLELGETITIGDSGEFYRVEEVKDENGIHAARIVPFGLHQRT